MGCSNSKKSTIIQEKVSNMPSSSPLKVPTNDDASINIYDSVVVDAIKESSDGNVLKVNFDLIMRTKILDRPTDIPIARRDKYDEIMLQKAIVTELKIKRNDPTFLQANLENYIRIFADGVWSGFRTLNQITVEEYKPYNERAKLDPDYWYELNTSNSVLFASLSLDGVPELLPGRLFTTRMPRDIKTKPEATEIFRQKVLKNKLHTVMVLTEPHEYQKYAGSDLVEFYQSLGLHIMSRPIPDFDIPKGGELVQDVKDLTYLLASGKNCMVHCAGGSGRTGMIIASVFRNLGLNDPIAWIRRVKSLYVETKAQEDFINSMPLVLDPRICQEFHMLAKAIASEHLLDAIHGGHKHDAHTVFGTETVDTVVEKSLEESYLACFDIIDADKSGTLSLTELREMLTTVGAEIDIDAFITKVQSLIHELDPTFVSSASEVKEMSSEKFVKIMKQASISSVRHY